MFPSLNQMDGVLTLDLDDATYDGLPAHLALEVMTLAYIY